MKTLDEKLKIEAEEIAKIKQKLKEKEARHAKTKAAIVSRDRKAENHRKFQNGGEIEKWLGSDCDVSRIAAIAQIGLEIEKVLGRKLEEADVKKLSFSNILNTPPEENESDVEILLDDE